MSMSRISAQDMQEYSLKNEPVAIKGITKIHQIVIERPGTLLHRELSCYCCSRSKDVCKFYNLTDASVTPTLSSVAQRLNVTIEQEIFERRWREGFNPVIEDLGVLSPEEREDYMRWKV